MREDQETIFDDPYLEGYKKGIANAKAQVVEKQKPKNLSPPDSKEETPEEKKSEVKKKLDKLSETTEKILYRAKGVWPFDFFGNELIISRDKVDFVFREFFLTREIQGVPIRDITDARLERGPIFATLKVVKKSYVSNRFEIGYLWCKDAIRARHIIQGLMSCSEKKIDVTLLSRKELMKKLEEIGSTQVVE